MHTINAAEELTVALYVREELPPPAREQAQALRDRLEHLEQENAIDELVTDEWDGKVPLTAVEGPVRDQYLAFTQWAASNEYSLTPFFATRECYSPAAQGWTDWLVLPAICLSVTVAGSLEAVYPHTTGAESRTVEDGLAWLESELLDQSSQPRASAD